MSGAREAKLDALLAEAMAALWNVQGVLNLIRDEGSMGRLDFPQDVASGIRMMSFQVDSAVAAIEPKM